MHPTVKPVAFIADLLLDCSKRNGIVLDMFGGIGTIVLAAENTGRRARVIELDPLYVDLAVRRWQAKFGEKARVAGTEITLASRKKRRLARSARKKKKPHSHKSMHTKSRKSDAHQRTATHQHYIDV